MRTREKGFNIDVTKGQYMMLYNIIAEHNSKVLDANPDFDMQTFDNLFQAITMASAELQEQEEELGYYE